MRFYTKETLRHISAFTCNFPSCVCGCVCSQTTAKKEKRRKKFGIILRSKDHAEGMVRNGKRTTHTRTVHTHFAKLRLLFCAVHPDKTIK